MFIVLAAWGLGCASSSVGTHARTLLFINIVGDIM